MASKSTNLHADGHVYDGILFPPLIPGYLLDQVKKLKLDRSILLPAYPKTGSTWYGEVVWMVAMEGDMTASQSTTHSARIPFLDLMAAITGKIDKGSLDEALKNQPYPRMIKSHLTPNLFSIQLQEDKGMKVLISVRNPKDTLVSFYHFYKANLVMGKFTGSWDEFFELFRAKSLYFGDFFDWYSAWWVHKDNPNVMFVKYEDMKRDLRQQIKRVSIFLDKDLSDQTIDEIAEHCSFNKMKDNKMTNYSYLPSEWLDQDISPFMRKGQIGDWKNYFSDEQSEYVDRLYEEKLKAIGLELEFE